jgi:predicted lipid-binding transport protein (Tim44 family)
VLSLAAPLLGRLGRARLARRGATRRVRRAAPHALPAGLDVEGFLAAAREHFVQLQSAWDAGDGPRLAQLATGPLLADLRQQLDARDGRVDRTEVVALHARLLAFEPVGDALVASVEFSGLVRERPGAGAERFRELWLLARLGADADPHWRLAQVQALA